MKKMKLLNKQAFSLIELMICVTIIIILTVMAVKQFSGNSKSELRASLSEIESLINMSQVKALNNCNYYFGFVTWGASYGGGKQFYIARFIESLCNSTNVNDLDWSNLVMESSLKGLKGDIKVVRGGCKEDDCNKNYGIIFKADGTLTKPANSSCTWPDCFNSNLTCNIILQHNDSKECLALHITKFGTTERVKKADFQAAGASQCPCPE